MPLTAAIAEMYTIMGIEPDDALPTQVLKLIALTGVSVATSTRSPVEVITDMCVY